MLRPRHEGFISYCSNHQQTPTYLQLNIHNNRGLTLSGTKNQSKVYMSKLGLTVTLEKLIEHQMKLQFIHIRIINTIFLKKPFL